MIVKLCYILNSEYGTIALATIEAPKVLKEPACVDMTLFHLVPREGQEGLRLPLRSSSSIVKK